MVLFFLVAAMAVVPFSMEVETLWQRTYSIQYQQKKTVIIQHIFERFIKLTFVQ